MAKEEEEEVVVVVGEEEEGGGTLVAVCFQRFFAPASHVRESGLR